MSINSVSFNSPQYHKKDKLEDNLNPVEKTLVNSVAPARRIIGLPDMIKQGDAIAAAGLAALTIVSLPEDCRDIKAAYDHSACALRKRRLPQAYNYKKYQHDFSFFRGTLLHEGMKRIKSEGGKRFVDKLYSADKTIYNTKFGKWLKKLIGIEDGKFVKSKIKNLYGKEISVQQTIVKNDFLGLKDLTARAMKRTTVLGLGFMGLLELPKIIKSLSKGKTTEDKTKSFAKQSTKSAINLIAINIGMGYLGALGAKKYGALGSLLGMGLGVIAGAASANSINKNI